MSRSRIALVVVLATATVAMAQQPARLTHRVWLLSGVPSAAALAELQSARVDGVAVPIGDADIGDGTVSFTLRTPADVERLRGWKLTPVVWVRGDGKSSGNAEAFLAQLAPAQRSLPAASGLVIAAREFWPGLPTFCSQVAARSGQAVELALAAAVLREKLPAGGWKGVTPIAIAFGNPPAVGIPFATLQDDADAIEAVDGRNTEYRIGLVVAPRAVPAPGPQPVSLGALARGDISEYRPGEHGDVFTLRRAVDWGGTRLDAGQRVEADVVDTSRYHRDLGLALRPVRDGLLGWDTIGLPRPEPSLGMSLEAFVDYLRGGMPYPVPRVDVELIGATVVRVAITNPSPHASALSSSGNWVELQFGGSEIRDVQLGEFSGLAHGRLEGGVLRGTVARDATVVRLLVIYLAPRSTVGGGTVTFLVKPRQMSARWGVRLADGSDVVGPLEPVSFTRP